MIASFPHFGSSTLALELFFEDLGAQVVAPTPPTKRTLELGVRYSPEQICLPFKITLGNMIEGIEKGADSIFMAAGTRKCRFGYYYLLQERVLAELNPDCRLFGFSQYSATEFVFKRIPEIFGISAARSVRAISLLIARSALIHDLDQQVRGLRPLDFSGAESFSRIGLDSIGNTHDLSDIHRVRRELRKGRPPDSSHPSHPSHLFLTPLRIGIVGEVYLMLEPFANAELEKELGRLGVHVLTDRSLYNHVRHLLRSDVRYLQTSAYARRYIGESPGGEVTKTLGEAIRYARDGVDGIIHIFPFTCMPENMALEILQKIGEDYHVPVMSLSFDEHTSRTGLVTRLEAFVDMLRRRRHARAIHKECA
jgi:predicted nucleotide-binding protein (sugar kinase/HSP70/actin superfamily)